VVAASLNLRAYERAIKMSEAAYPENVHPLKRQR